MFIAQWLIVLLAWLGAANMALAGPQQRVYYASGTGFFVSHQGYFITNAHVVKDCKPGSITLSRPQAGSARLLARDDEHDLALLRASLSPTDTAKLSDRDTHLRHGDAVMVIGYPGNRQDRSRYAAAWAELIDITGPQGEEEWLQFSDSVQQGNSGGPLLDDSGNVIGVVTGKSELYRVDRRTQERTRISRSDIAVALPVLRRFLLKHHVPFVKGDSRMQRGPDYIERRASDFISEIRCVTHVETVR